MNIPKRILAALLCVLLCILLSLCFINRTGNQNAPSLQDQINDPDKTLPFNIDDVRWFINGGQDERIQSSHTFRTAMQVPYGEIQFGSVTLDILNSDTGYQGERPVASRDVICFAVSLAAMLPANTTLNEDVVVEVFQTAQKCFDKAGIPVFFSERYTLNNYCFHVFATREQIMNLTCDNSVALYIFVTGENRGIKDYYKK